MNEGQTEKCKAVGREEKVRIVLNCHRKKERERERVK